VAFFEGRPLETGTVRELCWRCADTMDLTTLDQRLAAARRPSNYADLSAQDQWTIDKELGILDWDGR